MRPQPLVVHLRSEEHARCVVDALDVFGARLIEHPEGWDVYVEIRSNSLGDLLSALHQCLQDNTIPLVRVTVDERTYAMEPSPPVSGHDGQEPPPQRQLLPS